MKPILHSVSGKKTMHGPTWDVPWNKLTKIHCCQKAGFIYTSFSVELQYIGPFITFWETDRYWCEYVKSAVLYCQYYKLHWMKILFWALFQNFSNLDGHVTSYVPSLQNWRLLILQDFLNFSKSDNVGNKVMFSICSWIYGAVISVNHIHQTKQFFKIMVQRIFFVQYRKLFLLQMKFIPEIFSITFWESYNRIFFETMET